MKGSCGYEPERLVRAGHAALRHARRRRERGPRRRGAHCHGPALHGRAGRALWARPAGATSRWSSATRTSRAPCQARFEEIAIHCLRRLHGLVPTERVAMAGGCALNGVANARILRDTPFRAVLSPVRGLGRRHLRWARRFTAGMRCSAGSERFHMEHAFWGPEYSDERLGRPAEASRLRRTEHRGDELRRGSGGGSRGRQGRRLVPGPERVGPARARQPLHPREPELPDMKD